MSDLLADGNCRVSYVPSIASKAAPTTTELNAGTGLESFITPDGLDISPATAPVDTSSLSSTFTTQGAGRRSYNPALTLKRQTGVDGVYNLLQYQVAGFLVVRRNLAASTAWATGQLVEVYPIQFGEVAMLKPAPNEVQKYTAPMFMTADAAPRAVIA